MNSSLSSIIAGLFFSTIGFWLLKQAKQKANLKLVVISIILIGYSYFTTKPLYDWGIGLALCALAYQEWE